jgi:hypothetical protein
MRKGKGMNTMMRIPWILTLVVFAGGCSTTRVVRLPGDDALTGADVDPKRVVAIRDRIKVDLRGGGRYSGRVRIDDRLGVLRVLPADWSAASTDGCKPPAF